MSNPPSPPWLITFDWQPHAKKRPRISAPRAGKRPRTHQDPADKAAEEATREKMAAHIERLGIPILTGNVRIGAVFYRQSKQIVDLDNLLKHLLDSGNGLLWDDDSQITRYDRLDLELDRERPRTEFWWGPYNDTTMLRGTDR